MDLLKDKGFAPQTDVKTNNVVSIFNGIVSALTSKLEQTASHYDFMDLMRDNGFVPEPVNDNVENSIDVAATVNAMVGKLVWKIEHTVEHHDFMDLLHDKGFVPTYSNDNAANVQVA